MELMEDAPAEQPEQQETHEECNINDILNESYKTVSGGEAEPAQVNESAQMSSQVGTPANSAPESLCSSIKKDGAQCRNKIRSNGKCHQHGG